MPEISAALAFLEETTRRLLAGCRVSARDGTVLYVPDGRSHYQALWTRDFAYMVENAGDLMPAAEIEGCIRYLLGGRRADGVIPDRVRPDGLAVYAAGAEEQPVGEWNLDNGPFLALAADEYLRWVEAGRAAALRAEWAVPLARGLEVIPLSPAGLVWNDPDRPHSPYGFTDTIGKTGELLFESLLLWQACRRLGGWQENGQADDFARRARRIESGLLRLWDAEAGALRAASEDCNQVDVWGNAFALWCGFPLGGRRAAVLDFLARSYDRITQRGQVRHLLTPETWQRLLIPVAPGEYQNGAYWATASGWLWAALREAAPRLAERLLAELCADFAAHGVYECVNGEYRKLESYVVSAANIRGALKREEPR